MAAVMSSINSQPPSRRSWANTNSKHMLKAYDKSPVTSPTHSPSVSRNNSYSSMKSVDSTQSGSFWHSNRSSNTASGSSASRRESVASQASVQTTTSTTQKKAGLKGLFNRSKDPVEKEKKKKETERIVLGSRHAAAVKTKLLLDPEYKKFTEKHHKPNVKTAGITGHTQSSHSSAAEQEARHPHSGPPAMHGATSFPALTRIESHDEPDDEIDEYEEHRREWNEATDKMAAISEIHSRRTSPYASPWASPSASREPSPSRSTFGSSRPALGSKRSSYAGGFIRDEASGRWKKTSPSGTGTMTPVMPHSAEMTPDLLAQSLAERLSASS